LECLGIARDSPSLAPDCRDLRFPFAWIVLEFLVRFVSFQRVAGLEKAEKFSGSCLRKLKQLVIVKTSRRLFRLDGRQVSIPDAHDGDCTSVLIFCKKYGWRHPEKMEFAAN
jgi:hypothetical protein